jgi:hypothetical protein
MMPEAAVALATFVIVLLVLKRWTRDKTEVGPDDDEDARAAKRFVETKVDEHVEFLAQRYLEAGGAAAGGDEMPGRFAHDIEAFIATALMRDSAEQIGLGAAVRQVVTLEREQIYAQVLARVQAHLVPRRAA